MHTLAHLETVLILEDECLISIELADLVTNKGVSRTHLATSAQEALDLIAAGEVSFAVVDVVLNAETCEPVVEALSQKATPFIYVSGLTQRDCPDLPLAPWVAKPVDADVLLAAILAAAPPTEPGTPTHESALDGG